MSGLEFYRSTTGEHYAFRNLRADGSTLQAGNTWTIAKNEAAPASRRWVLYRQTLVSSTYVQIPAQHVYTPNLGKQGFGYPTLKDAKAAAQFLETEIAAQHVMALVMDRVLADRRGAITTVARGIDLQKVDLFSGRLPERIALALLAWAGLDEVLEGTPNVSGALYVIGSWFVRKVLWTTPGKHETYNGVESTVLTRVKRA